MVALEKSLDKAHSSSKTSEPHATRIKCEVCGNFKHSTQYSRIQLRKPHPKCQLCASGDQRSELKCQGPCSKVKLLSEFSKSSRKAGGNLFCSQCTNWKMSVQPNVSVAPAPGTVQEEETPTPANDVEAPDDGDNFDAFESTVSGGGDWYRRTGTQGYETTSEAKTALSSLSLLDTPEENRVQNTNPALDPAPAGPSSGWNLAGSSVAGDYNAWNNRGEFVVHQRVPTAVQSRLTATSSAARAPVRNSQWAQRAPRSNPQLRLPSPPPPQETNRLQRPRYDLDGDSDSDYS